MSLVSIQALSKLTGVTPIPDDQIGLTFLKSKAIGESIKGVHREVEALAKREYEQTYAKCTSGIGPNTREDDRRTVEKLAKETAEKARREIRTALMAREPSAIQLRHEAQTEMFEAELDRRREVLANDPTAKFESISKPNPPLESYGHTLDTLMKQQAALVERFKVNLLMNPNPRAMLDSIGTDSTDSIKRKNELLTWMQSGGAASIINAARRAIAEGDGLALSVCARALESLPKKERPGDFDSETMAEFACGKRWTAIKAAALRAELDFEVSELHAAELMLGKSLSDGMKKIGWGMREKNIDEMVDSLDAKDEPLGRASRTPIEKIAYGLKVQFGKGRAA